jgi:hypothetical protein
MLKNEEGFCITPRRMEKKVVREDVIEKRAKIRK